MVNKIASNKQIAFKWMRSFNDHDVDELLSLYAEDAVHFSPKLKLKQPETNGWLKGKPALRSWWAEAFDRLPTLRYELQNLVIDGGQVLLEYLRSVSGENDMMVAEILEIENGLITASRVYHA